MALKRLELPDGQWADQLVKPKHAEYVAITRAAELAERGVETWTDWALTVGQQFTKDWSIRDEDATVIEPGDWDALDPDISDALCTEAQNRWREWRVTRRPLVTPRRPSSSPESKSETSGSSSADS